MTEKQAVEKTNYAPQPAGGGGEQTVSSQIDMINEAYNQEQQVLGGLESSARSQEETASNKCLMIFSKEMQHFWLQEAGGSAFESSLGDAMGERFGRTAASELGGLENQRVSALSDINLETEKVGQNISEFLLEFD